MMKVKLLSLDNQEKGEIALNEEIFDCPPRADILHQMVVAQRASQRAGTHKVKSRGEIIGSTRKIMKQKGSGSARHGTRKVNIFRGGGVVHGPQPRSYKVNLPKKIRLLALRLALSAKAQKNQLMLLDRVESKEIKTATAYKQLQKLSIDKALIIDDEFNKDFALSVRNIPNINLLPSKALNVYDILRHDILVLTQSALKTIEGRLA